MNLNIFWFKSLQKLIIIILCILVLMGITINFYSRLREGLVSFNNGETALFEKKKIQNEFPS